MMRKVLIALALLLGIAPASAQNYAATAGSGLTFGAKSVSAVLYPQVVFCDPTTPTQCVGVNASGQMAIQAPPTLPLPTGAATSALQTTGNTSLTTINTTLGTPMQSSGGSVTANAGTNLNTSALATSATQGATTDSPATLPTSATAASEIAIQKAIANSLNGATPAGTNRVGYVTDDPCSGAATKSSFPITVTTSTVKVIATGLSGKKTYICHLFLTSGAADNVAIFEATTATTCATSPIAVIGAGTTVATAGNGLQFAANGGVSLGNGGHQIAQTSVNNNDLCVATSAATPLSGVITVASQ
jgi:hypothetical protein